MTDLPKPWRAKQFKTGYSAEYLPPGQRSWRFVKSGGEVIVFGSFGDALGAAENAYLQKLEPNIRATLPVDPERLEAKWAAKAEDWLRIKRGGSETIYRGHGKKPLLTLKGSAG